MAIDTKQVLTEVKIDPHGELDFDAWRTLYQQNPQAFEQRRKALVNALIADAPVDAQRRLKGLQFQIDMERRRCANATSAYLRISYLMWEKLGELNNALGQLTQGSFKSPKLAPVAQVLPFSPRATPEVLTD